MLDFSLAGLPKDFHFEFPQLQRTLSTYKLLICACSLTCAELAVDTGQLVITSDLLPSIDQPRAMEIIRTLIEIIEQRPLSSSSFHCNSPGDLTEIQQVVSLLGLTKEVQAALVKAYINVDSVCMWMAVAKHRECPVISDYCKRFVEVYIDRIMTDHRKLATVNQLWPQWLKTVMLNKFSVR